MTGQHNTHPQYHNFNFFIPQNHKLNMTVSWHVGCLTQWDDQLTLLSHPEILKFCGQKISACLRNKGLFMIFTMNPPVLKGFHLNLRKPHGHMLILAHKGPFFYWFNWALNSREMGDCGCSRKATTSNFGFLNRHWLSNEKIYEPLGVAALEDNHLHKLRVLQKRNLFSQHIFTMCLLLCFIETYSFPCL